MAALNAAQRTAVETTRGPLLVLAGAGTGKTRVVTFRIARLIELGIAPDRILAVTFTNKAASEMRQRVSELLGRRQDPKPEVSTFHSLCVRVLRRHIRLLGYPEKFAIFDAGEQETIAREVLRELKASTAMLGPSDLLYQISFWKSRGLRPAQASMVADSDRAHLAASGYRRYQDALKRAGGVDFDDLLLCTEDLFTGHPAARDAEAGRFDHILIDEYQDTNASQYRIVKALADRHRNLCVVGDDDQSIYGWRGAEVEHILRFREDWPDAKVVRLEENYRSTAQILGLANRLIQFNQVRHDKTLIAVSQGGERPQIKQFETETDEVKHTVQDIQIQLRNHVEPRDIAVLFRTNEQPRAFEAEFRRVGVPYVLIGATSFFDRKEVKDTMSFLRVIDHPHDETALRRVINTPPRGIGAKSVDQLIAHATAAGQSLWKTIEEHPEVAGTAAAAVQKFRSVVQAFHQRSARGGLSELVGQLLNEIDYRAEISRCYEDDLERQTRWDTVEELVNALGAYETQTKRPSLREFLDQMSLQGREFESGKEKKLSRNAVALMTLHSAKGLEFPHVYLVGLEEGILPHKRSVKEEGRAIDEERRLCYVGITRAQLRLTLSMARSRLKWGKPRPTEPSRFLWEMTGQADRIPRRRPAGAANSRKKLP
ncbi:MAG: UvrD-helicase domain-containing protein [Pirellulales bacterium]